MSRIVELRRFAEKADLGMEIAPYFAPIVSKSEGYNVLVVDVFDTDTLREHARKDPNIAAAQIKRIEDVDIVSDASRLKDIIDEKGISGQVNYILSSHNFEHLPDPISFLQGCSAALRPGGYLTMAIPDCRTTFDHFRMPTRLSDWLAAFHLGFKQPSPETLFDLDANRAFYMKDGAATVGMNIASDNPKNFKPVEELRKAYAAYVAEVRKPSGYRDTHCNVVFGASFELMICDLKHLGLLDLEIEAVMPTIGLEFIVHLRKPEGGVEPVESEAAFYKRRHELLREVNALMGTSGLERSQAAIRKAPETARHKARRSKGILRRILGNSIYTKLRAINAERNAKRRRSKN